MSGRKEHEREIEKRIEAKIKNAPDIIRDYYYSFDGNTITTAEAYIRYVIDFTNYFKEKDLFSLKKADINRYMASIKYREKDDERVENSASIRAARLAAIRHFYNYLVDNELIETNPCATIKPPKDSGLKRPVYMTPREIRKVGSIIKSGGKKERRIQERNELLISRDYAIFLLGCSTGLRCSAITEIDMDDIDFEEETIQVVEKGNRKRTVYLGDSTLGAIRDWLEDREKLVEDSEMGPLFVSTSGKRLHRQNIADLLKKYTADLDKNISPHKMRSSCATNLYKKTKDIYLVQNVLGHTNIANTMRYADVDDEGRRIAAEKLDTLF